MKSAEHVRAVCPFMIYGELVQRWRLSKGVRLLKWPHNVGARSGRPVCLPTVHNGSGSLCLHTY